MWFWIKVKRIPHIVGLGGNKKITSLNTCIKYFHLLDEAAEDAVL